MAANPWLLACVVLASSSSFFVVRADNNDTNDFCPDLKSQGFFDIDELMRMWYVVEVMEHKQPATAQQTSPGAISRIDKCPVVHLHRLEEHRLKLLWEEAAGVVQYHFRLPIPYTPGYWVADGPPNSTLSDSHGRRIAVHFSGDVRVMKAVASHLVLTFCSPADNNLWTIVLSLERSLSDLELRGVNKMLERRGLSLSNVRQTCGSAAATAAASAAALATLLSVAAGVAALGSR